MTTDSTSTRRLYKFEQLFLHTSKQPGNKDTPIGVLRSLGAKVWADYNTRAHDCPEIKSGDGVKSGENFYSFYEVPPVHRIVLARNQR